MNDGDPIGSDCALDNALITAPQPCDPELLKKLDAVAGAGYWVARQLPAFWAEMPAIDTQLPDVLVATR